jgi:exosortase/archaeosortase family protein
MQQEEVQAPRFPSAISQGLKTEVRAQIIGRVALSIAAICVDLLIVPTMYSARPFFTLAAFAVLVLISSRSRQDVTSLPKLSAARLAMFAALHVALIYTGVHIAPGLSAMAQSDSSSAPFASAAKILLVVPALALFPLRSGFFRRYASELTATAIVLFTFFPGRYFQLIWPWYSAALGQGVTLVSRVLIPGTYLDGTSLTVIGRSLDMEIAFTCSGITGINLFHLVFGFIVALEWNRLNKVRASICYFAGALVYMVANFVRLVILFLAGNLVSPNLNLDLVGWLVFAATFYVLIKVAYGWMVREQEDDRAPADAQVTAA